MKKLITICLLSVGVLCAQSVKVKRGSAEEPYITIPAGECASFYISVNGARPGDYVIPSWPELGPFSTGTMFVSRADTVEARVCAVKPSFVQAGKWKALVVSIRSNDDFDSSLLIE